MIRSLLLPFVFLSVLFAESAIVSSIPLPKTYVLNLDPYDCDDRCLHELIAHEQVFSFLAQMPEAVDDPALNEQRLIYVSLFNLDSGEQGRGVRIAMLLPEKVIGRYAVSTTNSALAYLLGKNRSFELKTFQTGDESAEALREGINRIAAEGFGYVIAPLTKKGANTLASMPLQAKVFFPTVNARDVNTSSEQLFFGGINYQAQITMLMREAEPPLIIFYDESALGESLKEMSRTAFLLNYMDSDPQHFLDIEKQIHAYPVGKHTTNLKSRLYENEKIRRGTFILNTPLVKSGMIMSQLTLYDVNASRILSTQINYDPLLFDITQPRDRENMIIANSIGEQNSVLVEANQLLQNDILFDWINYATTLGVDYFYHLGAKTPREYDIPVRNNQIRYPIRLYRPDGSRFELYFDPQAETAETPEDSAFEQSPQP